MADSKLPTITKVLINYCDRNVKLGLRSTVNRLTVKLDGLSQEVKDQLWHEDGKIHPFSTFMGSVAGTGVLIYKFDDTYNGKDIELCLTSNDGQDKRDKASAQNGLGGVKFHTRSFSHDGSNVSEFTEFIVIQTFLKDEKKPHVEIHPLNRRLAVFKNPKYGSATIKLEDSKFWDSVEMYYHIPDPRYTNYIGSDGFSYLNLRADIKVNLADSVFHHSPAAAMGGMGGGRGKVETTANSDVMKLIPDIIRVKQAEAEMRKQKQHDKVTTQKLMDEAASNLLKAYE
jgi:hypothetical protein